MHIFIEFLEMANYGLDGENVIEDDKEDGLGGKSVYNSGNQLWWQKRRIFLLVSEVNKEPKG